MGFVVGLNRDRDSYHVPVALAEVGELDAFVTDYYEGVGLRIPSLSHRQATAISPDVVHTSRMAFLRQLPYEAKRRVGSAFFPTYPVEWWLGRTVARVAREHPDSDLLLYSGSALQAFEGPSRGRRILFQYHPSPDFIAASMEGLDELADFRPWRRQDEVADPRMTRDHHREVAASELAICASSYTARGLERAGMARERIAIAPYGCPTPTTKRPHRHVRMRFLFCGQGSQRKGLHLLMIAWREARLQNAELLVISSAMDPEIEQLVRETDGVTLRSGLTREELDDAMLQADTFVLPSLLEGFGLVLGEALANGCRIISTSNTGLVDFHLPDSIATVIEPGKVEPLVRALKHHAATADPERPYHDEAVAEAASRPWSQFRQEIRDAVQR